MTTCFACAEFERNPQTVSVKAGCLECAARSIAASHAFYAAEQCDEPAKYRTVLDRVFHGDQKTGDTMVRRWAERMGVAA